MSKDIIYGKFRYQDKDYPFYLADYIVTVVQTAGEYNADFLQEMHFRHLSGITNNNQFIFLLDCDIVGGSIIKVSNNLQITCKGYILSNSPAECYDRIEFSSVALNGFYSPRRAIEIETDKAVLGVQGLKFRKYKDTSQKFSCTIHGEHIDFDIFFRSSVVLKMEDANIGSINTSLAMKFSAAKSIDDLGRYYLYLQDFLTFSNFRSDVPIDDITLYGKEADDKFVKLGTAKFKQVDCSQYVANKRKNIAYDDLTDECFAILFSVIAERRELGLHNPYFFPVNSKDAVYVDSAKWLVTAISFEGEFNQSYPDFKYQNDELFKRAKDLLLATIDKEVEASGLGISNRVNQSLNSFRHLISNSDTTIKEKFKYCYEKYYSEIAQIVERYSRIGGIATDSDFAQAYASYRNCIAHGTILPISNLEIVTYQLLRCFIYILILERGLVPFEKIKGIISKLF